MGFLENDSKDSARHNDVLKVLKRTFPPEFLNRIDETVLFNRLGEGELKKIVQLLIDDVNHTLAKHKLRITLTSSAVDLLVKNTSKDRTYGARPLRRAIQKMVEDPLAELMLGYEAVPSGEVNFDCSGDKLVPVLVETKTLIGVGE